MATCPHPGSGTCQQCQLDEYWEGVSEDVLEGFTDEMAFLGWERHKCDLCDRVFETLTRLSDHICQPVATDGGEEMVWVVPRPTGGAPRRLHTDPDCHALSNAGEPRRVPRGRYPDDQPECGYCTGTATGHGDQDKSHFLSLMAAAGEDSDGDAELATDGGVEEIGCYHCDATWPPGEDDPGRHEDGCPYAAEQATDGGLTGDHGVTPVVDRSAAVTTIAGPDPAMVVAARERGELADSEEADHA